MYEERPNNRKIPRTQYNFEPSPPPIFLLFVERFPQLFISVYYIYDGDIVQKPAETQSSLSG
jgi:hypothetical protein